MSAISDVQFGANTVAVRVDVERQEQDTDRSKWFSTQCDESVDCSFDEELLTLLPLDTTTRGADIYMFGGITLRGKGALLKTGFKLFLLMFRLFQQVQKYLL